MSGYVTRSRAALREAQGREVQETRCLGDYFYCSGGVLYRPSRFSHEPLTSWIAWADCPPPVTHEEAPRD
jgi:hypothetical protein